MQGVWRIAKSARSVCNCCPGWKKEIPCRLAKDKSSPWNRSREGTWEEEKIKARLKEHPVALRKIINVDPGTEHEMIFGKMEYAIPRILFAAKNDVSIDDAANVFTMCD